MKVFFEDLNSTQQFTLSLDHHRDTLKCQSCSKNNQFVSHGFVYKKQHNGITKTVGKRIFCSNRFGRAGCGRTFRLYLATEIPCLHYTVCHLALFLRTLIAGGSIHCAYQSVTKTPDPRNAYRWLNKLQRKLIDYRGVLNARTKDSANRFNCRVRRLKLLLPTISALFSSTISSCLHYQLHTQKTFI